jgi:hypothetical protein
MKDPARESLDARLAKLPPDIVPPRYLWPSIERQIERQPLRTPQVVLAAAAAVAALMIAGAVVWAVVHSRAATNAWLTPSGSGSPCSIRPPAPRSRRISP